jgi:hypothetical protein
MDRQEGSPRLVRIGIIGGELGGNLSQERRHELGCGHEHGSSSWTPVFTPVPFSVVALVLRFFDTGFGTAVLCSRFFQSFMIHFRQFVFKPLLLSFKFGP